MTDPNTPDDEPREMRTKTRPGKLTALMEPVAGLPTDLQQLKDEVQGDGAEATATGQQTETPEDDRLLVNRVHDLEVLKAAQDAHITFLHDQLDQLIDIVEGLSRQVTGKPQRPVVRTAAERRSDVR